MFDKGKCFFYVLVCFAYVEDQLLLFWFVFVTFQHQQVIFFFSPTKQRVKEIG